MRSRNYSKFKQPVPETIPAEILEKQSLDVTSVSSKEKFKQSVLSSEKQMRIAKADLIKRAIKGDTLAKEVLKYTTSTSFTPIETSDITLSTEDVDINIQDITHEHSS